MIHLLISNFILQIIGCYKLRKYLFKTEGFSLHQELKSTYWTFIVALIMQLIAVTISIVAYSMFG